MILHRFCSRVEFLRFIAGETLRNETDHFHGGQGGSLSRGFCFFSGDVQKWARRLNGLVDFDVLLTVEVDPKFVNESKGVYVDWDKDNGQLIPPKALFAEYCTMTYNRKDFCLIRADRSYTGTHVSLKEFAPRFLKTH